MDFCPKCDLPTASVGYDNNAFTRVQQHMDSENDYRKRRHDESRDFGQKLTIVILALMTFFFFLHILLD